MNKNLHDIDDYFRLALEGKKTEPSLSVWERLDAVLSKNEAKKYKKKYSNLKKMAAVFLLMLLSLVLYEVKLKLPSAKITGNATENNKNLLEHNGRKEKKSDQNNHFDNGQIDNGENGGSNLKIPGRQSVSASERTSSLKKFLNQFKKETEAGTIDSATQIFLNRDKEKNKRTFTVLNTNEHLSAENSVPGFALQYGSVAPNTPDLKTPIISKQAAVFLHKKNQSKEIWKVSFYISKDWSNYRLENNSNFNGQNEDIRSFKRREKHEPSISTGLLINHKIKNGISVSTGLVFSRYVIAIDPQKLYAVQKPGGDVAYKFNLSSGYAFIQPAFSRYPSVGDSMVASSAQHNLDFLGIPIMAQFKKEKKKLSFGIAGGISLNRLIHAKLKTEVSNGGSSELVSFSKLQGMRQMYLGFIANAVVEYRLSNQFVLSVLPSFKYAATSITKDNAVKTFPYSYGLGIGASFRL